MKLTGFYVPKEEVELSEQWHNLCQDKGFRVLMWVILGICYLYVFKSSVQLVELLSLVFS